MLMLDFLKAQKRYFVLLLSFSSDVFILLL